jgi:large subunit ribosomal protein L13e
VHAQTLQYNTKKSLGRGFSINELKGAGITVKMAPILSITVDRRRRNHSEKHLNENIARLKNYKNKLFHIQRYANTPISNAASDFAKVNLEMRKLNAYAIVRLERMKMRLAGKKKKRTAEVAGALKHEA